jgi:hypothetical protein
LLDVYDERSRPKTSHCQYIQNLKSRVFFVPVQQRLTPTRTTLPTLTRTRTTTTATIATKTTRTATIATRCPIDTYSPTAMPTPTPKTWLI